MLFKTVSKQMGFGAAGYHLIKWFKSTGGGRNLIRSSNMQVFITLLIKTLADHLLASIMGERCCLVT